MPKLFQNLAKSGFAAAQTIELPELGVERQQAVAWITVKESKLHGHHIYSVEAIKLEALDRIVEVVSGNTPHASSAPTRGIIATLGRFIKGVFA